MNTKEMWKPIKDYEGLYEVSDYGNVRRIDYDSKRINIHLKLSRESNGYLRVCLSKNNRKKSISVHRLVAISFIPNPKFKAQVNHINGIKDDNRVVNLEWVTDSENLLHAFRILKRKGPQSWLGKLGKDHHSSKAVEKYGLDNILMSEYGSINEASRMTGIKSSHISRCCRHERKTSGGFIWKYKAEKQSALEEYVYPIGGEA